MNIEQRVIVLENKVADLKQQLEDQQCRLSTEIQMYINNAMEVHEMQSK